MQILKSSIISFFLVLCVFAQGQELTATFTIRNAGFNVDGKFAKARIDFEFDMANLDSSFFNAEIEVASIDTGIGARDKHLVKSKYFDEQNFPLMTFKSTQIIKEGIQYFILGELQIKVTSKMLKLPLEINDTNLATNFTLNRRDYDVGGSSFILSDEVNITLKLAR